MNFGNCILYIITDTWPVNHSYLVKYDVTVAFIKDVLETHPCFYPVPLFSAIYEVLFTKILFKIERSHIRNYRPPPDIFVEIYNRGEIIRNKFFEDQKGGKNASLVPFEVWMQF